MYISPATTNLNSSFPNVSLTQPTFHSTPSNLNASFQRPKYSEPQPTTFLTAILRFCPPIAATCFGCLRSLQYGEESCSLTKSRRPISRDDNGIMQYATDSKIFDFHLSEDCVRSVFPNFVSCYSPFMSTSSQIIVTETKQLLVAIRYSLLIMNLLFF